MTQRLDLYANSLTEAIKPSYKAPILKEQHHIAKIQIEAYKIIID